jgi:hypothetical protein
MKVSLDFHNGRGQRPFGRCEWGEGLRKSDFFVDIINGWSPFIDRLLWDK